MIDQPPPPVPPLADPRLRAYFQIIHLKTRLRRGWLRAGISPAQCESVADHSFGTALLCLLLAQDVDPGRAALMALVHELGEVHAGDIIPADAVAKPEKHRRELASVDLVLAGLDAATASPIRELWDEYEAGTSPTARFVKAMDSLEMSAQAVANHHAGYPGMAEFLESAGGRLAGGEWEAVWRELADTLSPE